MLRSLPACIWCLVIINKKLIFKIFLSRCQKIFWIAPWIGKEIFLFSFINIFLLVESEQSSAGLVRLLLFHFLVCWGILGHSVIHPGKFYILMGDIYIETTTYSDQILCLKYLIFKRKKVNEIFHFRVEWKITDKRSQPQ